MQNSRNIMGKVHHIRSGFLIACAAFMCLAALTTPSFAENGERLKFARAAVDLNANTYGGILQDSQGFLWFATMGKGVIRYDGYELRNYPSGENGLSGAMVNAIVEGAEHELWFGTFSNGVTRYDKKTNIFTHFKHDPNNENSLSSDNLPMTSSVLLYGRDGVLWVGTKDGGLNRYAPKTDTWTRYKHDPIDPNSLSHDTVLALAQDQSGNIWVGTASGLNRLDPQTGRWTRFRHFADGAQSLGGDWVNDILVTRDGEIWVGGKESGLSRFDPETQTFTHYRHDPSDPHSLSANEIWSLAEGRNGKILLSRMNASIAGFEILDRNSGEFTRYPSNPNDPTSVSTTSAPAAYQDMETGILWVLNSNGVIDQYAPYNFKFNTMAHDPRNPNSLTSNLIEPMVQDSDGTVWVGTGKGLNAISPESGEIRRFNAVPEDPTTLPAASVSALLVEDDGLLWVGTWGGALSLFDRENGVCIKHYRHTPGDPDSLPKNQRIIALVHDRDDPDIIWIGALAGGLCKFNKKKETFTTWSVDSPKSGSVSNNMVDGLYDDGQGVLWITTYGGGLNKLDKKTGEFTHYKYDPNNPSSIGSNTVYEIQQDADGVYWIPSKNGVSRFDQKTGQFTVFNKETGLPSNGLASMLIDDNGEFWFGATGAGLVRFNPKTLDVSHYTQDDGLPSDTFFWRSRLKTSDGELWFGGNTGLVRFRPQDLKINPVVPPIVLTRVSQGNRELDLGEAASLAQSISLQWPNNYFEFQFAALGYTNPGQNHYKYKLEGRDTEWYDSGHNPFGRYTGLEGGDYTLKLKGANNDGVWNEQGLSLRIHVTPPFWKASWFFILVTAAAAVVAFFIILYMGRLRREVATRKEAQLRLRRLVAEAPYPMGIVNRENQTVEYLNNKFVALFGYSMNDIPIVDDWLELGYPEPEYRKTAKDSWKQAVIESTTADTEIDLGEWRVYCKDGQYRQIEHRLAPLGDLLLVAMQDMTQHREMEASLREAKEAAEAMNTLKSQFLANMSHEIRTPMNGILGMLQLLSHSPLSERQERYTKLAYASCKRLTDLLSDILDISRIEAGKVRLVKEPFSLAELVAEVENLFALSAEQGGITFHVSMDPRINFPLLGDSLRLRQVLVNLVGNALKFTPQGKVEFHVHGLSLSKADGARILFRVRDTGIGIDESKFSEIFEKFHQGVESEGIHARQFEGAGLGLPIVKDLVELMAGTLCFTSELEQGTEFYLSIPFESASALVKDSTPETIEAGAPELSENLRLLLAEDDKVSRVTVAEFLQDRGVQVVGVENGLRALDALRRESYDCVLMDILMPEMDGLEATRRIRQDPEYAGMADIPIIALTAYASAEDRRKFLAAGIDAYLAKPITLTDLPGAITKTLSKRP